MYTDQIPREKKIGGPVPRLVIGLLMVASDWPKAPRHGCPFPKWQVAASGCRGSLTFTPSPLAASRILLFICDFPFTGDVGFERGYTSGVCRDLLPRDLHLDHILLGFCSGPRERAR